MDGISVEVAMQYTTGYHETVMSFANNIHTHEGGTHEQGFRTALTRVINDYARQNKILKASVKRRLVILTTSEFPSLVLV